MRTRNGLKQRYSRQIEEIRSKIERLQQKEADLKAQMYSMLDQVKYRIK